MNTIELVATSLDEAKEKASSQLGVSPDQVQVEVLEESKGLFGKPGKLTVKAWAEVSEEAPAVEEEKPKAKAKPAPKAKAEKAPKKESAKASEAKAEASEDQDEESDSAPAEATEEDSNKLVAYLETLLEAANLDVAVTASGTNGRYVNINLDGNDAGFLVGRRGETLNALQYYMNVVAARQLQNGVRVVLEGDSYREKRAEFLTKMAEDIATQVKERSEEAVLDALPAFERRVIHQALVDFEGVSTYSEGEEPARRVVIAPAEA